MTTRHILSNVTRIALAAIVGVGSASCGSELLRTGRGPAYMTLVGLQARPGGGTEVVDNLLSDVATSTGAVFNDLGVATFRVELKDQSGVLTGADSPTTPIQAITLTRYRITYRRADGRNTPGVDVPWGFDGAVTATIPVGEERDVIFDIVRHANKLEPPLRSLQGLGGQVIISTVAEIQFFGRDQNGNEVTVVGLMDVTFGDFPDEEA
jgi:hypothetical protein